jgi:tetratricopeptide (TPR) repeat protein
VNAKDADKILDYIQLEISGSTLSKTDLIILDILSNYDWKRPIYFVSQQGDCDFNLAKYLQFDGLAYKLVPLICPQEGVKQMDVDKMKDLLMTKYEFDSNRDTTVFVDYQNCYSFTSVMPIREMFVNTAEALIEQKRYDEAVELMDRCYEVTPNANYPYNVSVFGGINELLVINSIEIYLALGEKEKAFKLYDEFFKQTQSALIYFTQNIGGYVLDESQAKRNANYLYYLGSLMTKYGYPEKDEEINKFIDEL